MFVTKLPDSATSGQASALNATGTANAITRVRHCRLSNGISSSTASTGLTTRDSPIARPASHSSRLLPDSSHRKNNTSASRMQPLILVKTNVLVTDSVTNMAASKAGSATEVSE